MERKFGIEIEFTGTHAQAATDAICAAGVNCVNERYNHQTRQHWKIINDSTCGLEAVSPPLNGQAGLNEIKKVCAALESIGAKVNVKCGLHVHIDAADLSLEHIKNVVKYWVKFEDVFDSVLPKSRRNNNNQYCLSNLFTVSASVNNGQEHRAACIKKFEELDKVTNIEQLRPASRYMKLNLDSYWRHGTIEVRHHSGTLDAEKIINWIKLLQQLFSRAKEVKNVKLQTPSAYEREWGFGIQRMDSLFITLKLTTNKTLTSFFRKRARHFAEQYGTDLATR